MSLELNLISKEIWIDARKSETLKWENVDKLVLFNDALQKLRLEFNGRVDYYKVNKKKGIIPPIGTLEYTENTPIFEHFKILPFGYYLNNFPDDGLWKQCDIDSEIDNLFKETNKYRQSDKIFTFDKPYILFPLQSNNTFLPHSFDIEFFIRCMIWAKENRKYILFKLHPFTKDGSHLLKYWEHLSKKGLVSDYTILVDKIYNIDQLIDRAESVWTFSSGTGMQAAIKGKPVAHFWRDVDYFPISKHSITPQEANLATSPREEDRKRFLTWYYTKLTINSQDEKLIDRLRYRMEKCFDQRETDIEKIL